MVFGAVELEPDVEDFDFLVEAVFFVDFFLAVLFLAVLFLVLLLDVAFGAAGVEVEVVDELLLCACAVTNGTVDAPTNASRAKAETRAFIYRTPELLFLRCGQERCRTCPGRTADRRNTRAILTMFRRNGDRFHAPIRRISA